jgi:uncharacterized protein YegP (UPF0339 family)
MTTKQKPKNKPGIHLLKTTVTKNKGKEYYWHIVSNNGRVIARSSETYKRRGGALNSIRVAADVFRFEFDGKYFDHTAADVVVKKTWK